MTWIEETRANAESRAATIFIARRTSVLEATRRMVLALSLTESEVLAGNKVWRLLTNWLALAYRTGMS